MRIHINQELHELEELVKQGFKALDLNGRLAIIAFHSLEDRIVKEAFKKIAGKTIPTWITRDIPLTQKQIDEHIKSYGTIIKPFPLKPSQQDIKDNPRCRSARLRVIEKTSSFVK